MTTDCHAGALLLKPAILCTLVLSVAFVVTAVQLPFLVLAITVLLVLIVLVADKTPGSWFLIGASLHAVLTYVATVISGIIGGSGNNASGFLLDAFKIYFVGVSAMLVGYGLSKRPEIRCRTVDLNLERFDRLTLLAALVGSGVIAYVLSGIGFVQMILTGTFSRYFGEEQVGSQYSLYQLLLRRGLAILVVAIPILLLRWQQTKSRVLFTVAVVSLLSILSTARRGPILIALVSFALTNAIAGKNRRLIAVSMVILVAAFFVVQGFFVNVESDSDSAVAKTSFVLRSALTEVSDLAWVLSEWNQHWYMGATWAAAVWPVPATISTFKDTYVLSSVTKDIVGIPREAEHGGLRISLFGEAYLNFGYAAVVAIGLVFGLLVRQLNGLIDWAKQQGQLILLPFMFLYLAGLWQFYLSGTGVLSDSILSLLAMALIYGASMRRRFLKTLDEPNP